MFEPEDSVHITVLNMKGVQRIYQEVEVDDGEGNVDVIKLQATKEFKTRLNAYAYELVAASIRNALGAGRTTLKGEDLPKLIEEDTE